jgi:5-methylcytosine-specific restriction protein A
LTGTEPSASVDNCGVAAASITVTRKPDCNTARWERGTRANRTKRGPRWVDPRAAESVRPGCCKVIESGYRKQHKPKYGTWHGLYNADWRRYRALYLAEHPVCVDCEKAGRLTPATVVDHVNAHRGDTALFWDVGNPQALCIQCHDRKTAKETAGFGQ